MIMRIVAVADTHMQRPKIPEGDVFIHAGDFCNNGRFEEIRDSAEWVNSLPHKHKVIVAGNHDWPFYKEPDRAKALFRNTEYLQDSQVTIGDITFYGSPWQPAFLDWAFNLPRGNELARKWAQIPIGLDVLITHTPPKGFGDLAPSFGGIRVGCADLLRRLHQIRPRLHVFGHIHEDGGLWRDHGSVMANVTTNYGRRSATVFDFETSTHKVTEISVPER